ITEDTIKVAVKYHNHLRSVAINLYYGSSTSYYKKAHYQLRGMPPSEEISMVKIADRWVMLKE
ncbi:MAG: hypothetical protein WBA74_09950, partial [Cyclobacteriaceae bacterium]